MLDQRLQEIRSIAVPQGISGKPILSSDTGTLYYCTPWSVVAWDLESGIRRTVKELQYAEQELSALHREDTVLSCRVKDAGQTKVLLLSSENGMELHTLPEDAMLETTASGYFLARYDGFQQLMLFSRDASDMQMLLPLFALPRWLCIWIALIAAVKLVNVISGWIMHRRFVSEHTRLNKLMGLLLFALSLLGPAVDFRYAAGFVCAAATIAALQEGHLIRTGRFVH